MSMTRELRTWVDSVVAALGHINYSAGRRLLLNGLHPTLVASLPTFAAPADQARSDLIELVTRNASVAQVLLQNAVAQTQHAHPKVHTQLAAALRTLSALATAGEPKALIEINPWPAPRYVDLGIGLTPIRFQTPRARWHMQSTAGDADWEYAFNGITKGTHALRAVNGAIEVFASMPYSLGAYLGLRLTDMPCTARYWQASGPPSQQVWQRFGNAFDHKLPVSPVLPPSFADVRDGQPVAVHIGLSYLIDEAEVPDAGMARVELNAPDPGYAAVPYARAAQQVAHEIGAVFSELNRIARNSAVHVFYVGPAAVLMMAAGTLRIMRNLTVHERLPAGDDTMRFVPAVRFQNGNAKLVR